MKIRLAAVIPILCLARLDAAAQTSSDPDLVPRLERTVRYFSDDGLWNGSVLVARGNQVIFNKAYGYSNFELKTPNTPDTVYRIASLTKQFTATAILLMEQRGRLEGIGDLKVEDRLKKYLPDIPASWDEITLQHLLSHTSGIPAYTTRRKRWTETLSLKEMIDLVRDLPLDFKPGTEYRYDNSGYFLLGAVLEKASGESYAKFVQENFFTPFGMTSSGYDDPDAVIANRAEGYNRIKPGEYENASFMDMSVPYSAGALHSSTADLLKWQQALYGGDILDATELAKMTTPTIKESGYGLVIDTDHGRKRYSHSGGINGFNSFLAYYPDDKLTVVCLSNTKSPTTRVATFLGAAAHGDPEELPKAVDVPVEALRAYVGNYGDAKNPRVKVRLEKGRLVFESGRLIDYPVPESETTFFDRTTAAQLIFARDQSGAVNHVSVHQNGVVKDYARLSGTGAIASTTGLAGKWEATYHWMGATFHSIYTFDVQGETFSGTLASKGSDKGLRFTNGKIDGNRISFFVSELPNIPPNTSYTGTLEGNQLRLIYRNTGKRPPSTNRGGNIHLLVANRISD